MNDVSIKPFVQIEIKCNICPITTSFTSHQAFALKSSLILFFGQGGKRYTYASLSCRLDHTMGKHNFTSVIFRSASQSLSHMEFIRFYCTWCTRRAEIGSSGRCFCSKSPPIDVQISAIRSLSLLSRCSSISSSLLQNYCNSVACISQTWLSVNVISLFK